MTRTKKQFIRRLSGLSAGIFSLSFICFGFNAQARIYFLGSGADVYEKPHVDAPDPNAVVNKCSSAYKYTCNTPYAGIGKPCDGKYATPCVCPSEYNKDCTTNPAVIGVGTPCGGLYTSCQCGYSFNKTCTGKYAGVGPACDLAAGSLFYQSCKCNDIYQWTSLNCNGDDHPVGDDCEGKYTDCVCNPALFTEPCTGTGQVSVGTDCQGKYKSCTCEPEYRHDDLNCNGDNHPVGDMCGGKTNKCECNPEVFTETCDGHGELSVGDSCVVNGKYKSCKCEDTFIFDPDNCNLDDHTLEGEPCAVNGKYAECKCMPDKFTLPCNGAGQSGDSEACEGKYQKCKCDPSYDKPCTGSGEEGVGPACGNKYQSCCDDNCQSGYSKNRPSGPVLTQTTACGTTCYIAEPPCAAGFSTTYQNVNDCGVGGANGWTFSSNGTYGGEVCGKCTALSCPANTGTVETACGSSGTSGWNLGAGTTDYAGNTQCKICTAKTCPSGQGTAEAACGTSGAAGWSLGAGTTNYAGNTQCKTCAAKTCPTGQATAVAGCGSTGASGWSVGAGTTSYAGNTQCKTCAAKTCPTGYTAGTASCTSPKTLATNGYSGNSICGQCNCPASYSRTCTSPNIGVGAGCDNKYQSCCNNSCSGYTSVPTIEQCPYGYNSSTTGCGNICATCKYGGKGHEVCNGVVIGSYSGGASVGNIAVKVEGYILRDECVTICGSGGWRFPTASDLNTVRCAIVRLGSPTYDVYWYPGTNIGTGRWLFGEDMTSPNPDQYRADGKNFCACTRTI